MLSKEQLVLAKSKPKEFLSQYRFLALHAQNLVKRIGFFEMYDNTSEHCQMLAREAREALTLRQDIENLLLDTDIDEKYKHLLYLRYFSGRTVEQTQNALGYTRRWYHYLQKRALKAFVDAI